MEALPGLYIPKTEGGVPRTTHHPGKGREVASAPCLTRQETPASFPNTPILPQAPLPSVMEMHATHSRGVTVESMHAFASVCVPHFQSPVCRATDDDIVPHLGGPNTTSVSHQSLHTLREKWDFRRASRAKKAPTTAEAELGLTSPVMADQTLSVLSSEPLTMRLPQNWRQVMTWSS